MASPSYVFVSWSMWFAIAAAILGGGASLPSREEGLLHHLGRRDFSAILGGWVSLPSWQEGLLHIVFFVPGEHVSRHFFYVVLIALILVIYTYIYNFLFWLRALFKYLTIRPCCSEKNYKDLFPCKMTSYISKSKISG